MGVINNSEIRKIKIAQKAQKKRKIVLMTAIDHKNRKKVAWPINLLTTIYYLPGDYLQVYVIELRGHTSMLMVKSY